MAGMHCFVEELLVVSEYDLETGSGEGIGRDVRRVMFKATEDVDGRFEHP
jgi:hypothetical protein